MAVMTTPPGTPCGQSTTGALKLGGAQRLAPRSEHFPYHTPVCAPCAVQSVSRNRWKTTYLRCSGGATQILQMHLLFFRAPFRVRSKSSLRLTVFFIPANLQMCFARPSPPSQVPGAGCGGLQPLIVREGGLRTGTTAGEIYVLHSNRPRANTCTSTVEARGSARLPDIRLQFTLFCKHPGGKFWLRLRQWALVCHTHSRKIRAPLDCRQLSARATFGKQWPKGTGP